VPVLYDTQKFHVHDIPLPQGRFEARQAGTAQTIERPGAVTSETGEFIVPGEWGNRDLFFYLAVRFQMIPHMSQTLWIHDEKRDLFLLFSRIRQRNRM